MSDKDNRKGNANGETGSPSNSIKTESSPARYKDNMLGLIEDREIEQIHAMINNAEKEEEPSVGTVATIAAIVVAGVALVSVAVMGGKALKRDDDDETS